MSKSSKKYPLHLENWGGDSYLVISRGHHDLEEFEAKVRKEYESFGNFFECAHHCYFKAVPRDGYSSWYTECSPDTKGGFPATVAQEGYLKKFGTESWSRQMFTHGDAVVPLHDNFGENPQVEICFSYTVCKGETFRSKLTREENKWEHREANDYRLATDSERKLGYREVLKL